MRLEDGTELLDKLKDTVHEQYFEIERLNNIIKSFENWIKKNQKSYRPHADEYDGEMILEKLKELKEK